jgi:two-component sensor histidine kinase
VQGLLSRLNDNDRVAFDDLLGSELDALGADPERVRLSGPKGVGLRSSTVQTLALALHELATNAVKYGALGQPAGRLEVLWELVDQAGQPWLHIDWIETGVKIAEDTSPSRRKGQGRALIEKALPYQLKGRTVYAITTDGVRCRMEIPVSSKKNDIH